MPSLRDPLISAKTIDANDITLVSVSNNFLGIFTQCIERGGQVRLLMVDPYDQVLTLAARRLSKHQDPARFLRESEHALDNFSSLHNDANLKQGFHLNFISVVPPYGIWVIDAGTPKAEIWVQLYSFRDEVQPSFQLLPQRGGEMYNFFYGKFKLLWQSSKLWRPSKPSQP
jgi:hypothetical protein